MPCLTYPYRALPRPAQPRRTKPNPALFLAQPSRAEPGPAAPIRTLFHAPTIQAAPCRAEPGPAAFLAKLMPRLARPSRAQPCSPPYVSFTGSSCISSRAFTPICNLNCGPRKAM
jgi:hypothetical protein